MNTNGRAFERFRGKQSTQDIALFSYHDLTGELSGSGLVVVSFDYGREVAKQFADAWFEKTVAFMRKGPLENGHD